MTHSPPTGLILVVDDTPASLKLLVNILTDEGYHVLPLNNGQLALDAVAAHSPDLILLDVRMPDLHQALSEAKTLPGLIPICAGCKKIRDNKNFWHQVESYLTKHTGAQFTHSLCPDCTKKYYPELDDP